MKYGALPIDLGLVDLNPTEMMFWLYCPIKIPYSQIYIPGNLKQYIPLVDKVLKTDYVGSSYIYLTAKTLYVSDQYIGNRPGWHSDGFGTDDLNYIWYDRAPTQFVDGDIELSSDCRKSMEQMEDYASRYEDNYITYPDKHLLKLDQRVIHRSPICFNQGMRTFVKISVSQDAYDLEGNSINHELGDIFAEKKARMKERNHPSSINNPR